MLKPVLCRHCGNEEIVHGKKLGEYISEIDHEFTPVCMHLEVAVYEDGAKVYCFGCHNPSGPQPEFPFGESVLGNVVEPKIEFNFGLCRVCSIPLTEEYEAVKFCKECSDDLDGMLGAFKDKERIMN